VIAALFAVGLLASGLASSSVGAYAGAEIMAGLLRVRFPILARRAVTLIPALVLLAVGVEPTRTLVISQVVLSFGIAFAVVPLVTLNSDARVMGEFAARRPLRVAGWLIAAAVVTLNVALLYLTFTGRA
jgi:manganese transport protein